MLDLSDQSKELLAFYENNYELISKYELYSDRKQFIGNSDNRICRFCKKASPQTSFKDDAHAVPVFIGNSTLFTYEECDSCNHVHGDNLEDQFAKFLGLRRTMSKIKGRKGVPTYRIPGKSNRVSFNSDKNTFEASCDVSDNFMKIDLSKKVIEMFSERQPYRRRSAFKCLVKMAINIMPRSELQYFEDTLSWITEIKPDDDKLDRKFYCFYSVSPASLKGIDIFLFKRKTFSAKLPYMSFYLAFGNFTFQIFLPFCSQDRHIYGSTIEIQRFPALHEKLNKVTYIIEDLSSNILQKDEQDSLRFTFSGDPKMKASGDFPKEELERILIT